MRRHGWALCLGTVLAGSAAAQPPAGAERLPPAPDLPGEVVGRQPGATTPAPVDGLVVKPIAPPAGPLPAEVLAVPGSTVAAPANPVGPASVGGTAAPCPPAPACPTGKSGCGIGFWEIKDWLLFRSQSRQSGHFVSPYRPPLYTWFPCEPNRAPCGFGPMIAAPGCAPIIGSPALGNPGPEGLPPPTGPGSPPPLAGGTPVGKCLDAEVLTTFQPVAPGLGFTPGAAPMANPTTQVKPTGFKPK